MYYLNLFSYPPYEVRAVIASIGPRGEEGRVRGDVGEGGGERVSGIRCVTQQ